MAVRKLDIEKEAKMVVEAKIFSFTNWFSIYKRSLSVRRTDHAMRHDVIQYLNWNNATKTIHAESVLRAQPVHQHQHRRLRPWS